MQKIFGTILPGLTSRYQLWLVPLLNFDNHGYVRHAPMKSIVISHSSHTQI